MLNYDKDVAKSFTPLLSGLLVNVQGHFDFSYMCLCSASLSFIAWFNGDIQSGTLGRLIFFPNWTLIKPKIVRFIQLLFCERAGSLAGTTHKSLKRAASSCSETAINEKQKSLEMSNGEDVIKAPSSAAPRNKLFWWSLALICHLAKC